MKRKLPSILLAASCFLAGFFTCYWVMKPGPKLNPASSSGQSAQVATLAVQIVSTQTLHINEGTWYQRPDSTMQRKVPTTLRSGNLDLIDTRSHIDPWEFK